MNELISLRFLLFRAFLPFCYLSLLKVPLVLSFQGKNRNTFYLYKKATHLDALLQLVDKVIDKLLRTVEKDADFVFRGSSAYKGTTETRKTKSKKPPILRRFSRLNHKQLHTPPFQM